MSDKENIVILTIICITLLATLFMVESINDDLEDLSHKLDLLEVTLDANR